MADPGFRLSPDGKRIAHCWNFEARWAWTWVTLKGPLSSGVAQADEVEGWTQLVPAPSAVDRDAVMFDPEELPPAVVRRLVGWLSNHGVAVVEDNPDDDDAVLVYSNLDTLTELAENLLGHGPIGVRVATPDAPAAAPAPVSEGQGLIDEATAHHLAAVILSDLNTCPGDPGYAVGPEWSGGYEAGMRRAAELVCESSCIAHTAPVADEDQVQRVAEAIRAAFIRDEVRDEPGNAWASTAAEDWYPEARAAIAAMQAVDRD